MDQLSPLPDFSTPRRSSHRRARSLDFDVGNRVDQARRLNVTAASHSLEGTGRDKGHRIEEEPDDLIAPLRKTSNGPSLLEPARSPRLRQQSADEKRSLQLQAAVGNFRARSNSQIGLLPAAPLKSPLFSPMLFDSAARRTHARCRTEPGPIVMKPVKSSIQPAPSVPTLEELVTWHLKRQEDRTEAVLLTPAVAVKRPEMVVPQEPHEPPPRSPTPSLQASRAACRGRMLKALSKRVTLASPTLVVM